jgi:hypothetical protein
MSALKDDLKSIYWKHLQLYLTTAKSLASVLDGPTPSGHGQKIVAADDRDWTFLKTRIEEIFDSFEVKEGELLGELITLKQRAKKMEAAEVRQAHVEAMAELQVKINATAKLMRDQSSALHQALPGDFDITLKSQIATYAKATGDWLRGELEDVYKTVFESE